MSEIAFRSAKELAGLIRRRRIGCLELLDAYLARVERYNPNLNAIKQEAVRSGLRYLYEDGMRVVIEGRTSVQELLRVSK